MSSLRAKTMLPAFVPKKESMSFSMASTAHFLIMSLRAGVIFPELN